MIMTIRTLDFEYEYDYPDIESQYTNITGKARLLRLIKFINEIGCMGVYYCRCSRNFLRLFSGTIANVRLMFCVGDLGRSLH